MYKESYGNSKETSKRAVRKYNTEIKFLDFSKLGNNDTWAPGQTYYSHKDLSNVDYISRYIPVKDYGLRETEIRLRQKETKVVSLYFTPDNATNKSVDRATRGSNPHVATAERYNGGKDILINAYAPGTSEILLHNEEAGDRKIKIIVERDENYIDQRVNDLLGKMTMDEKIQITGGTNWMWTKGYDRDDVNIPQMQMTDGPQGVGAGNGPSTAYPSDVSLTATWNRDLAVRYGQGLGRDCRARGIHILLGPAVNIYRSPLCGRNFEYMGEDPYLAAQTSTNYIIGVQSQGVAATVKHFMGNNSDYNRDWISNDMDERTLHEIYLPTFKSAVQVAKTACVMSSYNKFSLVDKGDGGITTPWGEWTTNSHYLLTEVLRDRWGFKGTLMSDWGSNHDGHGLDAALAGLDLEMAGGERMTKGLWDYYNNGQVTEQQINDKARHILYTLVSMGFLDRNQKDESIPFSDDQTDQIALDVARECMVLLKNQDNTLPLDKKIAITGKNASGYIRGGGSGSVEPTHYVDIATGIQRLAEQKGVVAEYRDALDLLPAIMYTDESKNTHGFIAKYYNNKDVSGDPVGQRVETKVKYNWSGMRPDIPGINWDNYSVSWEGIISVPESANYEFKMGGDDGYRVYIDNEEIISEWKPSAYHNTTKTKWLEAGKNYKIRAQYFQGGGDAVVDFTWKKQGDNSDYLAEYLKTVDAVVACIGFDSTVEGEGHDRNFNLDSDSWATIESLKKCGKPVIVLLNSGGSLQIDPWENAAQSIMWVGYPGQQAGTAAAEIIFGDTNPSGHLPVSFEKDYSKDNPCYNNYWDGDGDMHVLYNEGIFVGYRGYDHWNTAPLYPFGHGLSYTTFDITDMNVGNMQNDELPVTFTLKNTGSREGAQVVQVYVGCKHNCPVERPVRELKQFEKINLKPGESKQVTVKLSKDAFTYYDQRSRHDFVYDPGQYQIDLGFSSRDIKKSQTITVN